MVYISWCKRMVSKCVYPLMWGRKKMKSRLNESLFLWENRKLYSFAIEAEDNIDFFWNLFRVVNNMEIKICSIQCSKIEDPIPSIHAIISLDFSDSRITPREALEIIRRELDVRKAQLIKTGIEWFIRNDFFSRTISDDRAIIFCRGVYEALLKGMREKFGSAGEAILYYEGFQIGYETCKNYVSIEHLIEDIKFLHRIMGWATIQEMRIDLEKKRAKIRVSRNFECELYRRSNKPYSYFYRGILAGLFSRIFKEEIRARETKCIAKGDPYCEFEIKPQYNYL